MAREMKGLSMVLLDLKLPDRDGWMVLEELKRGPELPMIPVLVFTVSSTQRQQSKALGMGASGYVVKPVAAANRRQPIAAA